MPSWDKFHLDEDIEYSDAEEIRQHTATRLACAYCRWLDRKGIPIPDFAKDWWKEHKRNDAKRQKQEKREEESRRLRKSAKAKARVALSRAEYDALGITDEE